ncbi:hypothetical protein [Nocardiopsis coralliicola]
MVPNGEPRRNLARLGYLIRLDQRGDAALPANVLDAASAALRRRWPLRAPTEEGARLAVVRRALRGRPRRGHGALEMRTLGGGTDEHMLLRALLRLSRADRAAYALAISGGLTDAEARAVLDEARAGPTPPAAELAAAVAAATGFDRSHQEALIQRVAFDPSVVRVRAHRSRPVRRAVPAVAAAAAVAAVLLAVPTAEPPRPAGDGAAQPVAADGLARTGADEWRETFRLDLAAWETRGERAGDEELLDRALHRWRADEQLPDPTADARLLFAGEVPGALGGSGAAADERRAADGGTAGGEAADGTVVLLHDPPRLVRYAEDGSAEGGRVAAAPAPEPGVAHWPGLRLTADGAAARYLLPPWVTEADTAEPDRGGPDWSTVEVDGQGVTAPVAAPEESECSQGPILRLRAPDVAHGQAYTVRDTGGLATAHIGYMPPPPAEIRRLGPHELTGDSGGFELWSELGCAAPPPDSPVATATAWEFAVTDLPGGGEGRWVCTRFGAESGRGEARVHLLADRGDGTEALPAGQRSNGWDCSNLSRHIAAGTWFEDGDGSWSFLAAGSRGTTELAVSGGADGTADGGELEVAGPDRGAPPVEQVRLSATTDTGSDAVVFAPAW